MSLKTNPTCAGCGRDTRNGVYMDADPIFDANNNPVIVNGEIKMGVPYQHLATIMVNEKGENVWVCVTCMSLLKASKK